MTAEHAHAAPHQPGAVDDVVHARHVQGLAVADQVNGVRVYQQLPEGGTCQLVPGRVDVRVKTVDARARLAPQPGAGAAPDQLPGQVEPGEHLGQVAVVAGLPGLVELELQDQVFYPLRQHHGRDQR